MFPLPERLYELSQKNLLAAPVGRRVTFRQGAVGNLASFGFTVMEQLSSDEVFLVHGVEFLWVPTAATAARRAELQHFSQPNQQVIALAGVFNEVLVVGERRVATIVNLGLTVFGGEGLTASMQFDAAGINNTATCGVWGWIIPRGNLQRG